MTAKVTGSCVGCGLCTVMCPGVFTMTGKGTAAARDEIPPEFWDQVEETAESCPVSAIELGT